jgi:hypothetical protein
MQVCWPEDSAHPRFSETGQIDRVLTKVFYGSKTDADLASKFQFVPHAPYTAPPTLLSKSRHNADSNLYFKI